MPIGNRFPTPRSSDVRAESRGFEADPTETRSDKPGLSPDGRPMNPDPRSRTRSLPEHLGAPRYSCAAMGAPPTSLPVTTNRARRGRDLSKFECATELDRSMSICGRQPPQSETLMSPAFVWNAYWYCLPSSMRLAMKSLPNLNAPWRRWMSDDRFGRDWLAGGHRVLCRRYRLGAITLLDLRIEGVLRLHQMCHCRMEQVELSALILRKRKES
jgi:hypothetical protein